LDSLKWAFHNVAEWSLQWDVEDYSPPETLTFEEAFEDWNVEAWRSSLLCRASLVIPVETLLFRIHRYLLSL